MAAGLYARRPSGDEMANEYTGPVTREQNVKSADDSSRLYIRQ